MTSEKNPKSALIIVDPQVDFCPGGSLPVPCGDEVIRPLNDLIDYFNKNNLPVFISRDWHSLNNTTHMGPGRWPIHCLQDTPGAKFHPDLKVGDATIISKGTDDQSDGYSSFDGHTDSGISLDQALKNAGVDNLVIGGLATDFCVRSTVIDALKLGYSVRVTLDTVRAVNLNPGDGDQAIFEMCRAGAVMTTSTEIVANNLV